MPSTFNGTALVNSPSTAASLSVLTLDIARKVTDVHDGTATGGSTTTLADTTRLTQQDDWWTKGTVWFLSGSHAGKFSRITDYAQIGGVITVPNLGSAVNAGDRYACIRGHYPLEQLIAGIQQALNETFILSEAALVPTQVGDGETVQFELPTGTEEIGEVWLEDPDDANHNYPSTHWRQDGDTLLFTPGYAPDTDWIIRPFVKTMHPVLTLASQKVSNQIKLDWLRWKAAEAVLYWGVGAYGSAAEHRITERLNRAIERLKRLYPRKPLVRVRTGEAGGW